MGKSSWSDTSRKWAGGLIVLLIFFYIYLQIKEEIGAAMDDVRLALTIVMFVWVLNWMRKSLGSPRLALLFALVISYLVFFKHPDLLLTVFGLMFIVYFLKPYLDKAFEVANPPWIDIMDFYKDLAEKGKGVPPMPMVWPYNPYMPYYYPYYYGGSGSQNQNRRDNE